MSFLPVELQPYVHYLSPPLIGAFIGYLTNDVAIRMLFRPLKKWHFLGIPIPMTPGVIPSKRLQFSQNMGDMVGDHLLTSKEIGKALQDEKFQRHLLTMIEARVGTVMHTDLGPVPTLIPEKFSTYFDIAVKTIKYQVKDNIHAYVQSPAFQKKVEDSIDQRLNAFLGRQISSVFTGQEREITYRFIETNIDRMLASATMVEWLEDFLQQKVYEAIQQQKSLSEILPSSLLDLLQSSMQQQIPALLAKVGTVIQEPEVRDKIVSSVCGGVAHFISSLGPMAMMVSNFLSMETVEAKIRSYLDEKDEDIRLWLNSEEVQHKVADLLVERFNTFAQIPLVEIVPAESMARMDEYCTQAAGKIAQMLQTPEVTTALTAMIKGTIESHLAGGEASVKNLLTDFIGQNGISSMKTWLREECLALLRSRATLQTLDTMIETMTDNLLQKRIGKLSNLLPGGVRDSIAVSLQKMASEMLTYEVPGLVESLQLSRVVTEKINSLDLLRLERLLLSIMEEQFKYINLFGGLLGFVIGCLNLLLTSSGY